MGGGPNKQIAFYKGRGPNKQIVFIEGAPIDRYFLYRVAQYTDFLYTGGPNKQIVFI